MQPPLSFFNHNEVNGMVETHMSAMSKWPNGHPRPDRVTIAGVGFDPLTENDVVTHVRDSLARGDGGRIITPNIDILRQAVLDPGVRAMIGDATLVVADGMPLIWASRFADRRARAGVRGLPDRITGASLIWSLCGACAEDGRRVYFVGGTPSTPGVPNGAQRAAAVLGIRYRGLRVAGCASPPFGFERDPDRWSGVCADIIDAKPDLVFVGVGFPKQELLINTLRAELPLTWFIGCGASVDFVVGDQRRAPQWMQNAGLEWVYRLLQEPRRLGPRYLLHDLPFALRLLAGSLLRGVRQPSTVVEQSVPTSPAPGHRGSVAPRRSPDGVPAPHERAAPARHEQAAPVRHEQAQADRELK
jgi:N-acetylglucosaminyldiphosphoundecaprenol N-acetyl-beta-D-mannosaminyltransferase